MAKFTAKTKFAQSEDAITALNIYTDMRGHTWYVVQHGIGGDAEWWAHPTLEAAKAYGLEEYQIVEGKPLITFALAYGPNAAQSIINGIEERLESARAAGQTPGEFFDKTPDKKFPWWLVVLGALAYAKHSKRRRR